MAIVTHVIIGGKSLQEELNSHPENKQCNAVLHVALPTALRAATAPLEYSVLKQQFTMVTFIPSDLSIVG